MKRIINYILVIIMLLWTTACDDFGDTNLDPNQPSKAAPELLLTGAQFSISTRVLDDVTPLLYVQQISEVQYTEDSRYQVVQFDFNPYYTGPLANLEEIISLNTNEETKVDALSGGSNNNQIAVATILKAYFLHIMTDRWGALPMSEALKGQEDFSPAYDNQEAIYTALFDMLNNAVAMMDGGPGVRGDIIFGGDMTKWAQFANTLRMIMAMRISDANPSKAQSEFESAVAAGVITEDVFYQHLPETNHQSAWYARFITRLDYAVSEPLVNYLKSVNDPRLPAFASPAVSKVTGQIDYSMYEGMPYGIDDAGNILTSNISFITADHIYTQDAPLPIFTMAQVHFYLAEAAMKGWAVSGTAQEHYEAGIAASMAQWGVDDGEYTYSNSRLPGAIDGQTVTVQSVADYITQPAVAWDPVNGKQLIAMQKWVANFLMGYEAWSEWRRTGFPVLVPAPDALNNSGQIPVRNAYPGSESTLNEENYKAAVASQGPDELDTRLWWDVN